MLCTFHLEIGSQFEMEHPLLEYYTPLNAVPIFCNEQTIMAQHSYGKIVNFSVCAL